MSKNLTERPRPRHRPDIHGLAFPTQPDGLVDERADVGSVDLQALDSVFDQFIGNEVFGEFGGVDQACSTFVTVLACLAINRHVAVADLISKQLAEIGISFQSALSTQCSEVAIFSRWPSPRPTIQASTILL